jgi:hypothetical protein
MKKSPLYIILTFLMVACGTSKSLTTEDIQITFLDDFVLPADLMIESTKFGGISGIEYHDGTYYLVCDHAGNPRFYKASIKLNNYKIDTVEVTDVILLNRNSKFLKENTLDLEAIRYNPKLDQFVLTSEGSIQNGKSPSIFHISSEGEYISNYTLPGYFHTTGEQRPRNNGVFEGLATSVDGTAYWTAMELPLERDGAKPKLFHTQSPVRITKFDTGSGLASTQFAMDLEAISKIPWMYFAVNGLTEILEYAPNRFLVLERAFSAGHGSYGNTVRIFDVDASNATNTLEIENLKRSKYTLANKKLIYDFKNVRKRLTKGIIDNIEGMTFGPDLPNGNKSLILVSDNNFNSLGKQLNQFILMEINIKK